MLNASIQPGGGQKLPPINLGDDMMNIDDKDSVIHMAKPGTSLPSALHNPYHSGPPPPHASYPGTSPIADPSRRASGARSDQAHGLDGPLPSLRSLTGIGEALDTSRPPAPSSYPQPYTSSPTQAPRPLPPPTSAPSLTSPHTTQSPISLHNHDASRYDRRQYEKPVSSYPPPFATQAAPQYAPAPQHAQDAQHWRLSHTSPTEPSYSYAPREHPATYAQDPRAPVSAAAAPPPPPPPPPPPSSHASLGQAHSEAPHLARLDGPAEQRHAMRHERGSDSSLPMHAQPYGDSVKRHLDHFDLENAFNDIADMSRSLWDFSQHFRNKAHHTQRSGPLPGSTPNLKEIDDMVHHTSRIHASLVSLQEVVLSQQAALAERQTKESFKSNGAAPVEEVAAAHAPSSSSSSSMPVVMAPPPKDGFAGSDAKKKRGRAAPPGRCHSCNRAETPEWRRGPDGARTLCNACGLHYAKLTRKMAGNKSSATAASNLKPRTMSDAPLT